MIVNQRKSCGLRNLVESQGTCNKKNQAKKANNASVYNLTSHKEALGLRDPGLHLQIGSSVVSQNGYKNTEHSQIKVR